MVSMEEAARALGGVLRLAVFDARAADAFGRDGASCARSFWAYAIAAPALLLILGLRLLGSKPAHEGLFALAFLIGQVVEAAGFPLLLIPLLRLYGRSERWAWFVAGYNWFNAAETIAFVTIFSLLLGPLGSLAPVLFWGAQAYFMVLEAFLADAVLEVGRLRAAGIVVLDVAFSLAVDSLGEAIGMAG